MKKFIYIAGFLSFIVTQSAAQNPEFYLILRFYLNDKLWQTPLYLGYDPAAADSLEGKNSWFSAKGGEQEMPPVGFDDFRFTDQVIPQGSNFGLGASINIRHKPDSASFQLSYEIQMVVSNDYQYASMIWDQNAIPAIIHNMILEPATISPGPDRKKTDMKVVSEMSFPNRDSIGKYRFMIITLYYNRDYLSAVIDGKEVVRTLSVISNPVSQHLSALLYMERSEPVKIQLFDVTGRMVAEQTMQASPGLNPIEMDCRTLANGVYKLVVASQSKMLSSQTVIVNR